MDKTQLQARQDPDTRWVRPSYNLNKIQIQDGQNPVTSLARPRYKMDKTQLQSEQDPDTRWPRHSYNLNNIQRQDGEDQVTSWTRSQYKIGKTQLQARQDPDTRRPRPSFQGWEFAHRFFERIACFLWAKEGKCDSQIKLSIFFKERRERIAHSSSFVMSDLSKLLRSLFCKEQQEQITQVAL